MKYDYTNLRKKLKSMNLSQEKFGKAIGLGRTAMYKRFANITYYTQPEIEKAILILHIPRDQIADFFFAHSAHNYEQDRKEK